MSARNDYTPSENAAVPNNPSVLNELTPLISRVLRDDPGDITLQESWNQKTARKTRDVVKRNSGLLLIIASQSFFSSMNVAVKKLNSLDPPVSTMQLIAVRMGITLFCSLLYMITTGVRDPILGPRGVRLLLLLRGFSGFIGLFGIYFSLQYLSLSDATVLTFLSPICTVFTGAIFLGETFSRRQILAGIISLVGVILIARPTFLFGPDTDHPSNGNTTANLLQESMPTERLVAVGVALLGVFGATGAYTTLRAIGRKAHALHSMTFFSGICVLNASISMTVMRTPVVIPTRLEWVFLLGLIGIFGFIAQVLLTMGFQYETAGRGTMAIYTQIVFALILERIFLDTVPTSLSVIGTVLILSSALYVALTKEASAINKESTTLGQQFTSKDDLERVNGCTEEADDT